MSIKYLTLHDFVEIYIKLVIAIVSFIAPLIVALLSVFSQGVGLMREKASIKLRSVAKLLHEQTGGGANEQEVKKSTDALTQAQKDIEKTAHLLDPKRQIYRVFAPLVFSLILIMMSKIFEEYSTKDGRYDNNHLMCILLVVASFGCTAWSLFVLKQIAWKVIETKEELNKKEAEKQSEQERGKLTPTNTPNP